MLLDVFLDTSKILKSLLNTLERSALLLVKPLQTKLDLVRSAFLGQEILKEEQSMRLSNQMVNDGI